MTFLGIDIGGTKRVVSVGDHTGEPLSHIRRPMENSGDWRADLECLIEDGRRLLADWEKRTGEGIAMRFDRNSSSQQHATAAGHSLCFEPLRERVASALWPHQAERLSIVPASLGDELPQRAGLAVALAGTRMDDSAV